MTNLTRYAALVSKPRRAPRAKPVQHEAHLQAAIVKAIELKFNKYVFVTAIPGGSARVGGRSGAQLKRSGVKSGITDLMLLGAFASYHTVGFMEVKMKVTESAFSDAQKAFRDKCLSLGIPWAAVSSIDEALQVVEGWF